MPRTPANESNIKRFSVSSSVEQWNSYVEAAELAGVIFRTGRPNVAGWVVNVLDREVKRLRKQAEKDQNE